MGRHSSDSGDDYKSRRRRSRSRSDSRVKKQKKSKRNRSPPRCSHSGNSSRSVSRTHDRDDYRRSRSRSTSHLRSKGHRTKERSHQKSSKSKSIREYRHSSPRSTSRRRSRSRNRDRSPRSERRSRSRHTERSRRSRSNSPPVSSKPSNKGSQDTVSAAELAERKIQMALRAAAAADEALKAQGVLPASSSSSRLSALSIADQQRRSAAIDSINNDEFVQNFFKSNRSEIPLPSDSQIDATHSGAMFSSARTSSLQSDGSSLKNEAVTHSADKDSIMHPNLYIGADEKMENWKLKVAAWKKRKLMQPAELRV